MPQILDGKVVREEIFAGLRPRVSAFEAKSHRPPGLAVVLVGEDPASKQYVGNKVKACTSLGIYSRKVSPPASISTEGLLEVLHGLNHDPQIDAILVQMPLPKQVDSRRVLEAVAPEKDADGFHPLNVGHLVAGRPAPRACTPAGIMEMLKYYKISVDGRNAVVVGRSDIIGKPMALMLLAASATVTICHSRTRDLAHETLDADVLVVATGRAALVTAEMVKSGAAVVDVGMNRTDAGLVGDVDAAAMDVAGYMTPVPGGVGPMTIACLLRNTVLATRLQRDAV